MILLSHATPAGRPIITELDRSGNLYWEDHVSNATYRVEWAISLDGEWRADLQHLEMILPDAKREHPSKLPVFYRIVRIEEAERHAPEDANTERNHPLGRTYRHKVSLKTGKIMLHTDEGLLSFGGAQWTPWRTLFGFEGDRLTSLPQARPGFRYGHNGNGRGPKLITNIGNRTWKNYSMEFTFGISGVSDRFNPHSLPKSYRAGNILFHVVNAKESWNEKGDSWYALSIGNNGQWGLGCGYAKYCQMNSGWGNPTGHSRGLARGEGLKLDEENGNRFRVSIRGTHIQIWMDGEPIVDVHDDKMLESVDGIVLDHGGVGFLWTHDCMGWISDFSIEHFES